MGKTEAQGRTRGQQYHKEQKCCLWFTFTMCTVVNGSLKIAILFILKSGAGGGVTTLPAKIIVCVKNHTMSSCLMVLRDGMGSENMNY